MKIKDDIIMRKRGVFNVEIKVDRNLCIGCGACIALCPNIFKYGSDGKSEVKIDNVTNINETDKECVKRAVTVCPVKAITVNE